MPQLGTYLYVKSSLTYCMLGGIFMPSGYLRVFVTSAKEAFPISEAMVRIYLIEDDQVSSESFYITDVNGETPYIPLEAPSKDLSLDENNRERTYQRYNVEVKANGYEVLEVVNVQIFDTIYTTLPLNLIPNKTREVIKKVSYIPDHPLLSNYDTNAEAGFRNLTRILGNVIIPKTVTVHLGSPTSNAEDVNVDFISYVKNVACSEIYPTWEEESLRANIYCQISLVLNRVYTEWYPSKGYNYTITNNTGFDQYFIKDRNIYDNISEIVDDIFNTYIQKADFSEPFYAEYCDGKIADCPGLKQWGTQDLALQGYSAFEILQFYYGDSISLVTTNNVELITSSYPGVPLQLGSSGLDVTTIQKQLNAIALNYPAITPIFPVDGIYGPATKAAVEIVQRQFALTVDGIVGKATCETKKK